MLGEALDGSSSKNINVFSLFYTGYPISISAFYLIGQVPDPTEYPSEYP